MTDAHPSRRQLAATIDEALDLLRDYHRRQGRDLAAIAPLHSLLEQCEMLIAAPAAPTPVHSMHHFACTGGTVIAKCLAVMPNTLLMSEIDPISPLAQPKRFGPRPFAPSDVIYAMRNALRPADEALVLEVFAAAITTLHRALTTRGGHLVIRDHAHSQFCTSAERDSRATLHEMLRAAVPLRSVVTVRHPLESFLSLTNSSWMHFTPATLEEYSRRYIAFLDRHAGLPVFKYEDFVAAPDATLKRICGALELPFQPGSGDLLGVVSLSGDSGRSSPRIAQRPRRAVPDTIAAEAREAADFRALCTRLEYDPT